MQICIGFLFFVAFYSSSILSTARASGDGHAYKISDYEAEKSMQEYRKSVDKLEANQQQTVAELLHLFKVTTQLGVTDGKSPPVGDAAANPEAGKFAHGTKEFQEIHELMAEISEEEKPKIQFDLKLDRESVPGAVELQVRLKMAKNLAPMDGNGLSDPYVILCFGMREDMKPGKRCTSDSPNKIMRLYSRSSAAQSKEISKTWLQKKKSKVYEKTLEPIFTNENFEFTAQANELNRMVLLLEIWDEDATLGVKALNPDDFMGTAEININEYFKFGGKNAKNVWTNIALSPEAIAKDHHWRVKLNMQQRILDKLVNLESQWRYKAVLEFCNGHPSLWKDGRKHTSVPKQWQQHNHGSEQIADILELLYEQQQKRSAANFLPRTHWRQYEQCIAAMFESEDHGLAKLHMSPSFESILKGLFMPKPIYMAKQLFESWQLKDKTQFLHLLLEIGASNGADELAQIMGSMKVLYEELYSFLWNIGVPMIEAMVGDKSKKDPKRVEKAQKIVQFLQWRLQDNEAAQQNLENADRELRDNYRKNVVLHYGTMPQYRGVEFTLEYDAIGQMLRVTNLKSQMDDGEALISDLNAKNKKSPKICVNLFDSDGKEIIREPGNSIEFEIKRADLFVNKLIFTLMNVDGTVNGKTEFWLSDLITNKEEYRAYELRQQKAAKKKRKNETNEEKQMEIEVQDGRRTYYMECRPQMPELPTIQYEIEYNENIGELTITVLAAKNLQFLNVSNPYVELYLLPETVMLADSGKPQFTNISPEFNFRHSLYVPKEELQNKYILFSIRDYHFTRKMRTRVGDVLIQLDSFVNRRVEWKYIEKLDKKMALLDRMLALKAADQIEIGNVDFEVFRRMPDNNEMQRVYFQKTLLASMKHLGTWVQYYLPKLKEGALVDRVNWHRQNMERIMISRLGKDADRLIEGKMEKFYKIIEWLKPDRVEFFVKTEKFVRKIFKAEFREAVRNARVPEARPYRQAIRRILGAENKQMTGYDAFLEDYGQFVKEFMQLLAQNAYEFKFHTHNTNFLMHIELHEQWGIRNGRLSNSWFLHNLLQEVTKDVLMRVEQILVDDYANLRREREKWTFAEILRLGVRNVKGKTSNYVKEMNSRELVDITAAADENAEKQHHQQNAIEKENGKVEEDGILESFDRDELLAAMNRAIEVLGHIHSNALGFVLQCVAKPFSGIKRKNVAKLSGDESEEDDDWLAEQNAIDNGGIAKKNVVAEQSNEQEAIIEFEADIAAVAADRNGAANANADFLEANEETHDLNAADVEESYGWNRPKNAGDIDRLYCPPVGIDIAADALRMHENPMRKLRDTLAQNIANSMAELAALNITVHHKRGTDETVRTKRYFVGRVILRHLGYFVAGENVLSVGQKIVDQLGMMMERKNQRLITTMNSDWDIKYAFDMVDFVGSTELNIWGKQKHEMGWFERFIQGIFRATLKMTQWCHQKAIKKRNFAARFLVQHIAHFQMRAIRDVISGKQDPVQFVALTFFTKFYLLFKGVVWLGKQVLVIAKGWRHYLFDPDGRRDFKRDLYEVIKKIQREWRAQLEEKIGLFQTEVWKDSDYRAGELERIRSVAIERELEKVQNGIDENSFMEEEEGIGMEAMAEMGTMMKAIADHINTEMLPKEKANEMGVFMPPAADAARRKKRETGAHSGYVTSFGKDVIKSLVMLAATALMYYGTYPIVLWLYYEVIDIDCSKDNLFKVMVKILSSPFIHGAKKSYWLGKKGYEAIKTAWQKRSQQGQQDRDDGISNAGTGATSRVKRENPFLKNDNTKQQKPSLGALMWQKCGEIMGRSIKMLHVISTFTVAIIIFMYLPI